jgi:putative glutamine amidotransferase
MSIPLIAVAGRLGPAGKVARTPVVFGGRRYLEAVLRAGGQPVLITPQPLDEAGAKELLGRFDGLVLMGGPDVDPDLFGQHPHPKVYGVNREQDDFEIALVRAALAIELPTLAVCRGLQVANVALGGTLVQHLEHDEDTGTHAPDGFPAPPEGVVHPVDVAAGTLLAEALGTTAPHGASYHHQALDQLGDGLRVTAVGPDGVIEAAEYGSGWFVGVQWHPEDTAADDPEQQALFDTLVAEARQR